MLRSSTDPLQRFGNIGRHVAAAVSTDRGMRWIVCLILVVHAAMLAFSATLHSPTLDEPAHLVAGISNWELGRFELYRVNPPLTRLMAAAPAQFAVYDTNWSLFQESVGARPVFALGSQFVAENGLHFKWLLTIARWGCIPISVIGGLVAFMWATELYGRSGGLVVLFTLCFSPNILAHAELVTPDMAGAAFGLLASYTFWRWLRRPGCLRAAIAGVALGLAELSKMSWIILFGLWPAIWVIWQCTGSDRTVFKVWLKTGGQLALTLAMAIHILNVGYAYDGTFTPLKDYTFVSQTLAGPTPPPQGDNRFRESLLGSIPVPFPKHYVIGIDIQKQDLEAPHAPSFLAGEWKDGGWWYYYLYGMLVKVPHGTQLLWGIALLTMFIVRRNLIRDEMIVILPAACLFILVSSQTIFSHHFRYVLPALALLLVLTGRIGVLFTERRFCFYYWTRATALLAVSATVCSTAAAYPHSLAYFNEACGGMKNGHNHLQHSSFDWGQDLFHSLDVAEELIKTPDVHEVVILYHGLYDPAMLVPNCTPVTYLPMEWRPQSMLVASPTAVCPFGSTANYAIVMTKKGSTVVRKCVSINRGDDVPAVAMEDYSFSSPNCRVWSIQTRDQKTQKESAAMMSQVANVKSTDITQN